MKKIYVVFKENEIISAHTKENDAYNVAKQELINNLTRYNATQEEIEEAFASLDDSRKDFFFVKHFSCYSGYYLDFTINVEAVDYDG